MSRSIVPVGSRWSQAWDEVTVENEIATLSYPWAQSGLRFLSRHLVSGAPVLEAGCGPGRLLHWLREQGYQAVGVDCSLTALAKARAYSPTFRTVQADVQHLPFRAASFGTCLSLGVVEHFPEGPDDCLVEMRRVLRPGGVLVISVPHLNWLARIDPPLKVAYRWLRRVRLPTVEGEPPGRYYRLPELVEALRRNSFEVLETMPASHAYALHSFSGLFRRRGAYHDVTALGRHLGWAAERVLPWALAFTAFAAARKPLALPEDGGHDARRD